MSTQDEQPEYLTMPERLPNETTQDWVARVPPEEILRLVVMKLDKKTEKSHGPNEGWIGMMKITNSGSTVNACICARFRNWKPKEDR